MEETIINDKLKHRREMQKKYYEKKQGSDSTKSKTILFIE